MIQEVPLKNTREGSCHIFKNLCARRQIRQISNAILKISDGSLPPAVKDKIYDIFKEYSSVISIHLLKAGPAWLSSHAAHTERERQTNTDRHNQTQSDADKRNLRRRTVCATPRQTERERERERDRNKDRDRNTLPPPPT